MNMDNEVKQRFKKVLFNKHATMADIAGDDKALQGRLSRQLNQGATLSVDTILELIRVFPDVSVEWLITGQGNMIKRPVKEYNIDSHHDYSVYGTNNVGGKNNKVTKEDNDLTSVIKTQAEQITKLTDQVTTLLQLLSQK